MTARRGWREKVEPGIYRAHRIACPSSEDRKPERRCRCSLEILVPGARPRATRTVTLTGSLTEARAERRRLMAAGRPAPSEPEPVGGSLDELAIAYFAAKGAVLAGATIQAHDESYRLRIGPALGNVDVSEIDRARCEVYLAGLVKTSSSRQMVEKTVKALRAILKTGVEWGWLATNPAADLRLPRPEPSDDLAVKRVLTAEQLTALFDEAASPPLNRGGKPRKGGNTGRVESMLRMAGEAGLRRGEVIGLRWPDLDLPARRVSVQRAVWQERTRGPNDEAPRKVVKLPKGSRPRVVAISDGIVEALARWWERSVVLGGADAAGYVWPGADGGPMGADTPGQALLRVLDRAGLVENPKPRDKDEKPRGLVGFHGLRHTAASIMLSRGVSLLVVSRQLGHRNPNVTAEVYAHLLHDAQLDEAMSAFLPRSDHGGRTGGASEPSETPLQN